MKKENNSVMSVSNRILLSHGNLMKLILAVLIFITVVLLPSFLSSGILYLFGVRFDEYGYAIMSDFWGVMMSLFVIAAYVFFLLPTMSGPLLLARGIVSGDDVDLEVLLKPFKTSKVYFRSLLVGVVVIVTMLLPILVLIGGISFSSSAFSSLVSDENMLLLPSALFLICATIGALIIALYASSFVLFVPGLLLDGEKPMRAFKMSFLYVREMRSGAIRYMVLLAILALVSLLSFGILFIVYVAPFILVSYFVLLNERKLIRLSCSDSGMEII